MEILVKLLSPDILNDYLHFFDTMKFTENPGWSVCYCYSFHFTGSRSQWNKEENRSAVIRLISEGRMAGYLAYAEGKAVGWCNANYKLNYSRLMQNKDLAGNDGEKICSVVCFLISPEYRRQGIAKMLLGEVCKDYSRKGFKYIEAYPGKGSLSSEKHYKGPLRMYEESGFEIRKELKNYYIVHKKLK